LLKQLFGLAHDTLRPFRHIKLLSPLRFLSLFLHAQPGFEKSGLLIKSIRCKRESRIQVTQAAVNCIRAHR